MNAVLGGLKGQFLALAAVVAAAYLAFDGLLVLLGLVCVGRAVGDKSQPQGNWKAAITYALLVLALAGLSTVRSLAGVGG